MKEFIYKIFVKLNEHNCITSVESTGFHGEQELIDKGYVQIDEGSERLAYFHSQGNYFTIKYGKPLYDEKMHENFMLVDGEIIEVSNQQKYEWYDKPAKIQSEKNSQQRMLKTMMMQAQQTAFLLDLPDEEAVKIPYCYPKWESFKGARLEKDQRIEYVGKLWKTRAVIDPVLEHQPPSIETSSLYLRIDETHAGTIDDPIPYDLNMAVLEGLYYIENELVYKCIRTSENPLYATCESMIGNYFEVV